MKCILFFFIVALYIRIGFAQKYQNSNLGTSISYRVESQNNKTFDEARQDCQADGGDLAILNIEDKRQLIHENLNDQPADATLWIGARRAGTSQDGTNGQFKWVDGSVLLRPDDPEIDSVLHDYWFHRENGPPIDPDVTSTEEACVAISTNPDQVYSYHNSFFLIDDICSLKKPFICEHEDDPGIADFFKNGIFLDKSQLNGVNVPLVVLLVCVFVLFVGVPLICLYIYVFKRRGDNKKR